MYNLIVSMNYQMNQTYIDYNCLTNKNTSIRSLQTTRDLEYTVWIVEVLSDLLDNQGSSVNGVDFGSSIRSIRQLGIQRGSSIRSIRQLGIQCKRCGLWKFYPIYQTIRDLAYTGWKFYPIYQTTRDLAKTVWIVEVLSDLLDNSGSSVYGVDCGSSIRSIRQLGIQRKRCGLWKFYPIYQTTRDLAYTGWKFYLFYQTTRDLA